MENKASSLFVIVLTALLVVIIWSCFAPGFMSYDSMVQYQTALDQRYTDSHPAIMSYIWNLCMLLLPGPQSLLILHLTVLVLGILIWCANFVHGTWAVLIPGIFFLPWVINFSGVLWKDVGMAFCLLLVTGLFFNRVKNKWMIGLAIPFIFYAAAVRHNAILAIAPIIFYTIRYYSPEKSGLQGVVITVLLSATLPLASSILSYDILKAEKKHFETFLMGDEIAKISYVTGENLLPWVRMEDIKVCSKPSILFERALCFISKGYDPSGSLVVNIPYASTHALWRKTVLANPLVYIQIRGEAFLYFLRLPKLVPYYTWHPGIMQNEFKIKLVNPDFAGFMQSYVETSQSLVSELFKPYIWLLLSLIMMAMGSRMRPSLEKTQVLALNASSLGYFFSYLLTVPSADFRYIYWCIIATNVSVVILLASRERGEMTVGVIVN